MQRRFFLGGMAAAPGLYFLACRSTARNPAASAASFEEQQQTLAAAVESIVGLKVEVARYLDFFRWRAGVMPQRMREYLDFCELVNDLAQKNGARSFAAATPEVRTAVLAETFKASAVDAGFPDAGAPGGPASHTPQAVVLAEVLSLFAWSDAWVLLGFDGWRGVPRGLGSYRLPPPGASR
jgi:hypothetical protein